jgi:hypothetical protein
MLRELEVIGLDLGNFMDEQEMRLTREQYEGLDAILKRIHDLEDEIKGRRNRD